MSRHRSALPQLGGDLFLSDGGIETTLIFLEGLGLPHLAAFDRLRTPAGTEALRKNFSTYAALANATRAAVGLLEEIRDDVEAPGTPIVISGGGTDDRRGNFDIYLPLPVAPYNKEIFGTLFAAGLVLALVRWLQAP